MAEKKTIFTACCLCYQSCGVEVTVEDGKVTKVKGQDSHPLNKGKLCVKGLGDDRASLPPGPA